MPETSSGSTPDTKNRSVSPDDPNLYNARYYGGYQGGAYERGGHWTRLFGAVANEIVARWNPATTLDAGCAIGLLAGELRVRDVDAWGIDLSDYAISQADEATRPYLRMGSLAEQFPSDLPDHFDLITCIETLEHMDVAEGDRAIANLCAHTDRILFCSTPDGFGEATHFACRPPEDWSAVFARNGFLRDFDANAAFLAPWAVVYSRQSRTTTEVVQSYDRKFARLNEENRQLRERVINFEAELSDLQDESVLATLKRENLKQRDRITGLEVENQRLASELSRKDADVHEELTKAAAARLEADEALQAIKSSKRWRIADMAAKPVEFIRHRNQANRSS